MKKQRPRILLVTSNLPPLVGGMERMMLEVAEGLSKHADLWVIGPRGCSKHLPSAVQVREISHSLGGFVSQSLLRGASLCRRQRFDIILGGSGLTGPCLLALQRLYRTPTAIFLHGLDLVADNWIYQSLFVPTICRANLVFANSRNTARLAICRGVAERCITVINPGCSPPDNSAHDRIIKFRQQHGIADGPLMLFVGRMTKRKGLSHFIAKGLPSILQKLPTSSLLVVGDTPDHAFKQSDEKQAVMQNIERLSPAHRERVQFLGQLEDDELNTAYAMADVHIFPVLEIPGDVEGFGMVVIEAASYGTPTVAFDAGGVADAIGETAGVLVPPNNYHAMTESIVSILQKPRDWRENCLRHASRYYWPEFHRILKVRLSHEFLQR
ncbi:MAG: glycosyltransferase family 4 protein [Parahaliea sp.]